MIEITPKTSLCRKTDFSLDSQFIFPPPHSRLLRNKIFCVKNYQDIIKLRQEKFLTCLDKILSRSYQGVPRNVCLSRSWQDVSSFARVNKILHVMARCIKFPFTMLKLTLDPTTCDFYKQPSNFYLGFHLNENRQQEGAGVKGCESITKAYEFRAKDDQNCKNYSLKVTSIRPCKLNN